MNFIKIMNLKIPLNYLILMSLKKLIFNVIGNLDFKCYLKM